VVEKEAKLTVPEAYAGIVEDLRLLERDGQNQVGF
jgi:hypothetical protein